MLPNYPAVTTIPATDLERAKQWYSDRLGFKPVVDEPEYVEFNAAAGTWFSLFPTRAAARAGHTVLTFEVDDAEKVVQGPRGRGVDFEEYDLPNLKTIEGIVRSTDSRAPGSRTPRGTFSQWPSGPNLP